MSVPTELVPESSDEAPADLRSAAAGRPREPSDAARDATPESSVSSSSEPGELEEDQDGHVKENESGAEAADASAPAAAADSTPPLPSEAVPGEAVPQQQEDDGWEYHWNTNTNSYWFFHRTTGVWQQENPRLATLSHPAATPVAATSANPPLPPGGPSGISALGSVAGGYNPAIHGNYDPNAWYAQASRAAEEAAEEAASAVAREASGEAGSGGFFNRATGAWQPEDQGTRHGEEARSRRQLNAFFDVDAAANAHDGRSLKAERAGKKPSKAELKAFKEKRRAKKEEKRRAWLRD